MNNDDFTRPEKIASLCHLVFLHETKLGYDNNPSVRAGSYKALVASKAHVPKAWNGLFVGDEDGEISAAANTVGMAWAAAKGDPFSEVVKSATEFITLLSNDMKMIDGSIKMAILKYSKLVIGCKRSSALQDVINPVSTSFSTNVEQSSNKDKKKGGKAAQKNAEATAALAEMEREEMEERFERVMLSVLIGLGSLIEYQPEKDSEQYASIESFPDPASITRLMSSSRGSFRRESYKLAGRFCQHAQSLVLPNSNASQALIPLATIIPNLISAEKDSSNFVPLLELVLSYLSLFGKERANANPWEAMDASAFVKSLCKALRKACCCAPAAVWGEMILPIVASLPLGEDEDVPLPLVAVESLVSDLYESLTPYTCLKIKLTYLDCSQWEGRKSAASTMDAAAIVSSVVECATYLLLRRPKDSASTFTDQSSTTCARLILDCLSYYLNDAPSAGGPAAHALDQLCMTIARDIIRLDTATNDDHADDSGIAKVRAFLWGTDGIQSTFLSTKQDTSTYAKMNRLMDNILELGTQNKQNSLTHMLPSFQALFKEIIMQSDSQTNKSCTKEEVELILKIMKLCQPQTLFPVKKVAKGLDADIETSLSLEEFCVNDLIRWILIHSKSALSAVPTDFQIAKCLLLSIQSAHQQKQIWETILKELIKSYCDVTSLATGLCAMAAGADGGTLDLIRCSTLDQFAMELSDSFIDSFWLSHDLSRTDSHKNSVVHHEGDMFLFFKTCVGLGNCKSMLISSSVIRYWVDCCYDESKFETLTLEDEKGSNALLETLLLFGSSNENTSVNQDDLVKLVTESWRQGGPIWHKVAMKKYQQGTNSMQEQVVSHASLALSQSIRRKPSTDHAIAELTAQSWSKKASRLLEVSKSSSLHSVGIDFDLCRAINDESAAESLFLRLMYLFHDIDSPSRFHELLFDGPINQELFVHIQASVVDSADVLLKSFDQRTRRNSQLVEILGGPTKLNNNGYARAMTTKCVDLLASHMKEPKENDSVHCRTLTTLSYLLSIFFPTKLSKENAEDDCILAEDVKEGDALWYEKVDGTRIKSTILKVHTDDFPNLYFTIREENSSEERQTIANRLKRYSIAPSYAASCNDDTEIREIISRDIFDRLIQPYVAKVDVRDDLLKKEISSECINVILSQIGLVSIGIGSVRYDIAQTMASLERRFAEMIPNASQSLCELSSLLRCIALASGYGLLTKAAPQRDRLADIRLQTNTILASLLELYDEYGQLLNDKSKITQYFHSSVAMWLTVSLDEVNDGDLLRNVTSILLVLCNECDADSWILLMNAVVAFQSSTKKCIDYDSGAVSEALLFEMITKCFVDIPDATTLWLDTYASILNHFRTEAPAVLLQSAKTYSDELFICLTKPIKSWSAFQLLLVQAKTQKPTGSSDELIISAATESFLSLWKEKLDEAEATELEDDVRIASFWLPEAMMVFIQNISTTSDESDTDNMRMGSLLSWILFLEIFDKAGAVDMRNRSSMCSFLLKSNAVGSIMHLALKDANLDVSRKVNIFDCIASERPFDIEEIATLVIFRTIEVRYTKVESFDREKEMISLNSFFSLYPHLQRHGIMTTRLVTCNNS